MILWLLGGGKTRFLMSHFFPKKLCQAQRLIRRWLKLNFIHFQEGGPEGVIHSTGRSDRLHCDCEADFFHGFFRCWWNTVWGSLLVQKWNPWITKDTYHSDSFSYIPTNAFFFDFSSLAESEGKEHLPQNPPLELEKSTGGETMSLDDKNFMLCLFQWCFWVMSCQCKMMDMQRNMPEYA